MASLLEGTAFITGAGSGIGQCTAYAFARHGVKRLAITDIDPSGLADTVSELRKRHGSSVDVKPIEMSTASEPDVERAIADTVSAFGGIDYAVNNAGIVGAGGPTHEVRKDDWDGLLGVNLTGVWMCQKAQLRQMLTQERRGGKSERGSIVNVASTVGLVGNPPTIPASAYTASKHGVMGLTRADAALYASDGIRINAVCPGFTATPMTKRILTAESLASVVSMVPMGRLAEMEEIADAIMFLSSPMARFVCGVGLPVDGGCTCL